MSLLEDVQVIPAPPADWLNERQLTNSRHQRTGRLEWLLTVGLDPETHDGYAKDTVAPRAYRLDQFYRWVWVANG